ncbi:hypothetical protein [Sorangium sp. So ce1097]|uniref:hypothetical protein n=1 Tax=Sorangium sp. So ce1097 TaxID=3133330 RepID=UPI003F5D7DD9
MPLERPINLGFDGPSKDARLSRDVEWLNHGVVLSGAGEVAVDNLRFLVWSPDGRWDPL